MDETAASQAERRANNRLRDIFDEGFALLGPFFEGNNAPGDQSIDDLAFLVMSENFPDLTQDEIYIFVMAAKRIYADQHPTGKA
ncbi:MAG: hypothetical protein HY066_04115 [Betaproteobacteria bacterium]|nr:hypothetical protein [Betaproteobacteria bacterium]